MDQNQPGVASWSRTHATSTRSSCFVESLEFQICSTRLQVRCRAWHTRVESRVHHHPWASRSRCGSWCHSFLCKSSYNLVVTHLMMRIASAAALASQGGGRQCCTSTCRLIPSPCFGYPILGLGAYLHKVGHPKNGLWYEPTGRLVPSPFWGSVVWSQDPAT